MNTRFMLRARTTRLAGAVVLLGLLVVVTVCCQSAPVRDCRTNASVRKYPMRSLKGREFSGLNSYYTGIRGRAPDTATIDFDHQLRLLWQTKSRRFPNRTVVQSVSRQVMSDYLCSEPTRMTGVEYVELADRAADQMCRAIDWDAVAERKRFDRLSYSTERAKLVRQIGCSLGGRELVAYGLTELMPSTDGRFNVQLLDFLVRNAGREYLESIPAIYDPYTSFGPFQFTSFALYDIGRDRRGASVINHTLPNRRRIPGSVARLRGDDHSKAAYLFAVSNLADLVAQLNDRELRTLQRVWPHHRVELVQYVATAHHLPAVAVKSARHWLDNRARTRFETSCPRSIRLYALKTRVNLAAL
jgi:hypothetical protein